MNSHRLASIALSIMLFFAMSTVNAQMSGNYTIATDGSGDFTTLNAAIAKLQNDGMGADVTLQLKPGIYNEKVRIGAIAGNSLAKQVIIESLSGNREDVTITYTTNDEDSSNYLIRLDDVKGASIRNITFDTQGAKSYYGRVIELIGITSNVTIEGNHFIGNRNSSAIVFGLGAGDFFEHYINPDSIRNLTVNHNLFNLFSPAVDSEMSFTMDVFHENLSISHNQFIDCNGINLANVKGLYFGNNLSKKVEYKIKPLVLSNCKGEILVEKNIAYTTTDGFSFFATHGTKDSPVIVRNNFVSGDKIVLAISGISNFNIAHNTFIGTSTGSSLMALYGVDSSAMYNNIFYNKKSDQALLTFDKMGNVDMDYNCYYAPDGTLADNYDITINTLEEMRTVLGIEAHGMNINPIFVSDTTYQVLAADLTDAGIPLPYITDDIEGDPRADGLPDIGVDESTAVSNLIINEVTTATPTVNIDGNLSITWKGENIGETTFSTEWKDHVYLSKDTQLDEDDVFLGSKINNDVLAPGDLFSHSKVFLVDLDNPGDYYVLVKLDVDEVLIEDKNDNIEIGPKVTVIFANRPNLEVTNISMPANINSGSVVTVEWTVTNNGDEATTENWFDYIYFSSDKDLLEDHENFDPEQEFLVKLENTVGLAPGESYTNSHQFKLPLSGSGKYYIKVVVDLENSQNELDESLPNNSTISLPISISQAPLSDLKVTSFTFPETAFSGEWIDFSYTVKNIGTAKTSYDLWTDYVYVITDSIPNRNSFKSAWKTRQEIKNWKEMEVAEELVIHEKIKLPYCESDTFYVFLLTDVYNQIEESVESNNTTIANQPIIVVYKPSADMVVERIHVPDQPRATDQLTTIEYDIYNRGFDVANIFNNLHDAIYLSKDQEFDIKEDLKLAGGWFFDTLSLAVDDKITRQISITWPDSLFGDYYVVVNTDDLDQICEAPYEGNNAFFSEKISIELAPVKDLTIKNLRVETSGIAGERMAIKYNLHNNGVGIVSGKVLVDSIYLVPENGQPNKKYSHWGKQHEDLTLSSNSSVLEEMLLSIPITTPPGRYQLVIIADAKKMIYEHEAENNNLVKSPTITITRDEDKLPDLAIQNVALPQEILSGTTASISFDISNLSPAETNTDAWKYRLSLLNEMDKKLGNENYLHIGKLDGNSTYTENFDFKIPDGISGSYRLVIHADINYKVAEYYKENNADTIDIEIALSPWPDLVVQNLNFPATMIAGQEATISWEVKNAGQVPTKAEILSDKIYVSKDEVLDEHDILLHSVVYDNTLAKGAVLSQNPVFRILPELDGNYYLIVMTDASNQEYEHTGEENNVFHSIDEVTITKPKPIDLEPVVSSIDFSLSSGVVQFGVRNNGPNTGHGSWVDAAFLSTDPLWDKDDVLMGYRKYSASNSGLESGGAYNFTIKNQSGFVKPDYYYVIIKSDVYNYMPETNKGNNYQASKDPVYIDMLAELIPGEAKDSVYYLNRNRSHYYKMKTKTDKGYLLTIDGKNSNNSTELFYKTADLPSRGGDFDFKGANDRQETQQIIVPSKDQATTDYILAYGDYVFGETMDYTLLAEEKEFSIVNITPEVGGNEGIVVMDINGFDFTDSLRAVLRNATDTVEAVHSFSISNILARAHFNTNSIDTGTYDVVLQRLDRGDKTVYEQAFQVQDTSYTEYHMNVTGPDRVIQGRDFLSQVHFSNLGNINDYDLFVMIAISAKNHGPQDFKVDYLGDGVSDQLPEELQALHPFSNEALFQDDKAYYFYTWLPVFAARSSGQFTFKLNMAEIDTINISAQIFANPISDIHFSGDLDDLKKTRFLKDIDASFTGGNNASSNARVTADCIDDPKAVEAMVWKSVRSHVEYVSGGIPGSPTQVVTTLVQEGLKSMVDVEAHDRAEGLVKDLTDERREITLDPTQKSAYDNLLKNLDNCLTPELVEEIVDKCLVAHREEVLRADGRKSYRTVYTNTCPYASPGGTSKGVAVVSSHDPNEIIGPEGIGEPRYIAKGEKLGYRINFENLAEANANAQRVAVENELQPELDERSFRLKEVGWGDTIIQLPEAAYFTGTFDLGDKYSNNQLQLTAGIDAVNWRVFWRFQTIDPSTGAPPSEFDGGFLPPNDSTGIGEGYVSYTIKAKNGLSGGTEVTNDAVIVFDQEKSLRTNLWSNMILGEGGVDSHVNELNNVMMETRFVVSWQPGGVDNSFQPDIMDYTVFVSKDNGQYFIWQLNTPEKEAVFVGEPGSTYEFYSIARTASGATESIPAFADAMTLVSDEARVTGIDDNDVLGRLKRQNMAIYPNPSQGELTIAYKQQNKERLRLSIISISGRQIYEEVINNDIPGTYFKSILNLQSISNGIYFIKIEGADYSNTQKWIKK